VGLAETSKGSNRQNERFRLLDIADLANVALVFPSRTLLPVLSVCDLPPVLRRVILIGELALLSSEI